MRVPSTLPKKRPMELCIYNTGEIPWIKNILYPRAEASRWKKKPLWPFVKKKFVGRGSGTKMASVYLDPRYH